MPPPFCSSLSPIQNGGQRRQPACSVRPWLAACGSAVGVELTAGPFFLQVDVPHSWFFLTEATGSITKMTFVTRRKRPFLTPPHRYLFTRGRLVGSEPVGEFQFLFRRNFQYSMIL